MRQFVIEIKTQMQVQNNGKYKIHKNTKANKYTKYWAKQYIFKLLSDAFCDTQ